MRRWTRSRPWACASSTCRRAPGVSGTRSTPPPNADLRLIVTRRSHALHVQPLPEMQERIATDGQPGEDVAHHRRKGKAVAAKAGRNEEALDTGHRAEDRQSVGRESFDAHPAPGDGVVFQWRVDAAGERKAPARALVEDATAAR